MPTMSDARVSVIGLGYIGLPTAALIAAHDFTVQGMDVSAHVVDTINAGGVHIEEADLDNLVRDVVAKGKLSASLDVKPADVFIIAVPTPFKDGYAPDISYVLAAARNIAPVVKRGDLVILESTSPVGTTEEICKVIGELRPDLAMPGSGDAHDIHVAYCPERVLPGRILIELVENDRSIGGITPMCAQKAVNFYKHFVKGECIVTSARAAEMVKLVENSFRDVNIAFANELSVIADNMGIDVWEVIRLANRHPRVNILQPGPGVGGHCIAVDPWFIVHADPENARLIRTARNVNDDKTDYVVNKASAMIDQHPGAPIAVLGLAFKPNIDDFRESPAVKVADALARRYGERVLIVEPFTQSLPKGLDATGAKLVSLDDAFAAAPVVVMLVDHDQFKAVAPAQLAGKAVYDTRGIWPVG